jgi:hypothetical protein
MGGAFEGALKPADAKTLPQGYDKSRKTTGERRVALGGHRIADAMRFALMN